MVQNNEKTKTSPQENEEKVETVKNETATPPQKDKNSPQDEPYLRLLAEFENFKKRTQREQAYWITCIKKDIITGILNILDDFDLAINHKNEKASSQDQEGLLLIGKKLMQVLEKQGLKAMEVKVGETFDANAHEAIGSIPTENDTKKDTIVEIIGKGYLLDNEIIRFAKVIVNQ